jgi:DNA-binding transcriptional LysR family regulator
MDRLTEMEAFAAVVDHGGFTDAARKLGMSKSAVSKHVSSLEARLGARLLNRTTRRVSPTEIGLVYYDRARRVLTDAGEADRIVTAMQSAPSGVLRLSVATDFGVTLLSPVLDAFFADCPEVSVQMVLNNRYVELISEGFDMAVRVGEAEDSSLRSHKITETTRRLIASPSYLQQHGRPQRIEDLSQHRLLHHGNHASANLWRVIGPSGEERQVRGRLAVGQRRPVAAQRRRRGLGIAYLPSFLYHAAMERGEVVDVIPDLPQTRLGIFAVHPPGRFTQPKVRAFIDFLMAQFAERGPDAW